MKVNVRNTLTGLKKALANKELKSPKFVFSKIKKILLLFEIIIIQFPL